MPSQADVGVEVGVDVGECEVTLRLAPGDAALARVVSVLGRKRWSVVELHYRRGGGKDYVRLRAVRRDGRVEHLLAALERDVAVIGVER
jgi:hypothetical protein